ncbi:MAG: MATE family efflux transporter [Planctomycetota bacterium]|jgi:MATE family multidrug resistance protein
MSDDQKQPVDSQNCDCQAAIDHDSPNLLSQAAAESWKHDLRLLLAIAAPNVMSTVAQTMLSMVDYAIVSQLGPAAQAAVSTGGMVFFSIFGMLLGMMVCVTTVVSQSLGANRLRDCSAYAWQGIWFSLLCGMFFMILWPVMPALYHWFGHAPDVQHMEISYTRIRLISLGVAGASVAMGHFFNGIHKPMQNTISVVGANIINAFLSYGLVFGKWGLPQMGVDGAAWGSVVACMVRALWLMGAMCLGKNAARFNPLHTWGLDFNKMRRLVRVGWPSGIEFVLNITAWAAFLAFIIGAFGTKHLAATATCWRFTEFSFMPAIGIGIAVSTIVGRSIGQGRHDLARRRARLGTLINMIYMGVMAVIFVLFGREFMQIFSDDATVINIGTQLMVFVAIFQLFDAVAITYSNALRGAGDTLWPGMVSSIQAWTIMVGGGTLMVYYQPQLGSSGPWIFATAHVIAVGITLWGRWHHGRWEQLDVIGRKQAHIPDTAT